MRRVLAIVLAVVLTRLLLAATGGSGSFAAPTPPTIYSLTSAPEGGRTFQGNPMAFAFGGYTYVGYLEGSAGDVKIAIFTGGALVATRTLHAAMEIDDHDNPTMYVRPDGKLHAFYSKHVGPDIYERISTSTLASDPDLSDGFGAEASLSSTFSASQSTYPSALYLSNVDGAGDAVFLFWREFVGATSHWWYATNDFSTGWSGVSDLHTMTYSKIESNGVDRIDMTVSEHPISGADTIYHLYRESAAWHKSDGTTIGGSMPFAGSDMTTVYAASGSDLVWIADLAVTPGGDPVIAFWRYPSGGTSDIRAMYAAWTGSAWDVHEIVDTGGYIPDTAVGANPLEVYYPGGLALDHADPNIVYISREVSGQWEMFVYRTANGGATWSSTQLTSSSSEKQIRPVGVRDQDDIAMIWDFGTYHSYVDYDLGMKGLAP